MGEPSIWLPFLIVVTDTWLKDVRVYFGSQFKGAVHCDREGMTSGT